MGKQWVRKLGLQTKFNKEIFKEVTKEVSLFLSCLQEPQDKTKENESELSQNDFSDKSKNRAAY